MGKHEETKWKINYHNSFNRNNTNEIAMHKLKIFATYTWIKNQRYHHITITLAKTRSEGANDQARFPLLGFDFVQRIFLPLARLRFSSALPLVVLIRLRKPCVRANDFRDLLLLVRQRAGFPALTTKPWRFPLPIPALEFRSKPKDKPED